MGKGKFKDLFIRHADERGVFRSILRQIHDMAPCIRVRRLEIRMLDDADEWKFRVVYIQPIRVREAMI